MSIKKAAFSDFLLSASSSELDTQVFTTNASFLSGQCINNSSTTVIVFTATGNGYYSSNKGSYAATLIFKAGQTNKNIGSFGLSIDPAPATFNEITYAWFIDDTPEVAIKENGSTVGATSAYTTNTEFKITYRNNTISYYLDGTLVRQTGPVNSYLYAAGTGEFADANSSLTNLSYQRYNLITAQTSPFTVTFQPSSINFEDQFVSKMVYVMPDRTIIRNFTFSTLEDALTGPTKDLDSRSNYSYTFFCDAAGTMTYFVTLSATLFPSLSTLKYVVEVPVDRPRLTRNPSLTSTDSFVFESAHLLKSRAWGPNNTILYIAEGINYDNTNQLFLLSSTQ